MDKLKIEKLKEILEDSKNIVVFTGAGVSVPSGIPDFRSSHGIYSEKLHNTYSPEEIISHHFFLAHPDIFFEFYKSKMVYPSAMPNEAHKWFKELDDSGKLVAVITQNIDGLDLMAGVKNVIELHGSVKRNYCMNCKKFYNETQLYNELIPHCDCGGIIKPDVVLYEEQLKSIDITNAINYVSNCDTLIVIGTSLIVWPAAGFIDYFRGKHLVVINKTANSAMNRAELEITADIVEVVENLNK